MPISSSLPHFYVFSILLLVTITNTNILATLQGQCLHQQKTLLLELKSEFKFDSSRSHKLASWNQTDDCCGWDGVECDGAGGVTGLHLHGETISGGVEESSTLFRLTKLNKLDLSFNSFSGTIPHSLFALPSLQSLVLSDNQFCGQVKEFPVVNISNLIVLDLSRNRLEGPIPNSFFLLPTLQSFLASHNLFNGTFQLGKIQSSLTDLDLSYNNLSVETTNMNSSWYGFPHLVSLRLASCNLYSFPDFVKRSPLQVLDLSNNRIAGDIPSWIWEIGNGTLRRLNLSCNLLVDLQKPYRIPTFLGELDLHSNQLKGEFPLFSQDPRFIDYSHNNFDSIPPIIFENFTSSDFIFFSVANNSLNGAIPTSLCNARSLQILDLSYNNFSGSIPPCVLKNHKHLKLLSLRGNNIHGVIPDRFSSDCTLRTLDLSRNKLGGKIPKSLANCNSLSVLNLGHNKFDDSFPCLLPSSLRVLVLRSNRFHGELRCAERWPDLQIVDMSSNNFSGTLHPLNLSSWRGMMLRGDGHVRLNYSTSDYLRPDDNCWDMVTLTVKGVEVNLVKIWPDFTSIDLSCNNFHGDIPDAIGNLNSLYVLNLSQNALTGAIPKSLGSLTELGSLDLSQNQLTGRIPEELAAALTFLSILNLSYNQLVGIIPNGPQFQTFPADWFEGNPGLCGFPLDTSCSNGTGSSPTKPKQEEEEEEIEWEYVCGAVGYVVGLGSIVWMLIFSGSFREIYYDKIEGIFERRRRGARRRATMMKRKRKEEVRRRY